MRCCGIFGLAALLALVPLASAARAQRVEASLVARADATSPLMEPAYERLGSEALAPGAPLAAFPGGISHWAGVAKWIGLGTTLGLGVLGFVAHRQAEDNFDRLEEICDSDPPRCRAFNADGSYADAELEALFQSVLDRDAAARVYLIGAQLGFAATVAFFIIDLKNGSAPENIPYEPKELRLTLERGAVGLRWYAF